MSRLKNSVRRFQLIGIAILALGNLTCDEPLPPFNVPTNVIRGDVIWARYILVVDDNSMEINLSVKNKYDETLEGVSDLEGTVEITLDRLPSIKKSLPFNYGNLTSLGKYSVSSKTLRFDPGDTLLFRMRWDFIANDNLSLVNSVFHYNKDPTCNLRCVADEETFSLFATLKLFDEVPAATYGPIQFTVCPISAWVDTRDCPPISTANACSVFPKDKQRLPCVTEAQ